MLKHYPLTSLAVLTLLLSACSTPVGVPVKPEIDASIKEPCRGFAPAAIKAGDDIRIAWLASDKHRDLVLSECSAKHQAVLSAVQ